MVPDAADLSKSGTKTILQMRGDGSNSGFRALISGGKMFGCDIEAGQWYTLVMYADITGIKYTEKTGAVGAAYLAKKGATLKCVAPSLAFEFGTTGKGGDKLYKPLEIAVSNSTIHFDNIAIYEDVREAELSTAAKTFGNAALGTGSTTINLPAAATAGYEISWTKGENALSGNDTAVFENEAKTVTYTAEAKNSSHAYTAERTFDINVPAKYVLDLSVSGSESTAAVTVNANSAADEGYADGMAILALYDAGGVLVNAEVASVTAGTASLKYDPKKTGTFTSKLFLWVDGTLKPLANQSKTFTNN